LNKDDRHTRKGFMAYEIFYKLCYPSARQRTYDDFMESKHYSSFVSFGRYLNDINAINPPQFVEFLLKAQVPLKDWEKPVPYEHYIRELNKKESFDAAIERNVLLIQQWSRDTGEPMNTFFDKVNTNVAAAWIKSGRLSPWVLYNAPSADLLLTRLTEEQISIIKNNVEPRFWERKFAQCPEDRDTAIEILKELGL